MFRFYTQRETSCFSHLTYASIFTSAAVVVAQPDPAYATVLEELANSQVVAFVNDASTDAAPPHIQAPDTASSLSKSEIASRAQGQSDWSSSVLFDISPAPAIRAAADRDTVRSQRRQRLGISIPRRMSMNFTSHQQQMRRMTVAVGLNYSRAESVRRAQIDRKLFAALFTAMIHRESNFNPKAVSPVGAKGLGQLMPDTARELGVEDAFSASENLDGAARYLTSMLDKFGSAELALAAYNAGPGAVQKYGGVPPYRETEQYIIDIFHAVGRTPSFAGQEPPKTTQDAPTLRPPWRANRLALAN